MGQQPLSDEQAQEAYDAWMRHGRSRLKAAEELGLPPATFASRLIVAQSRGLHLSEGARVAMGHAGLNGLDAKGGWIHNYDEDGKKIGATRWAAADISESDEIEQIIDGLCENIAARSIRYPKAPKPDGEHLLVISPADVHMGKLAEAFETGDAYTQEIAEARTKEGVLRLLEIGKGFGLEAITVNTGNDSLHVDNARKTTTSGTPQDTDGSIFGMCDSMFWTWVWVIETSAKYAPVHVVFDPSNHPWVSDWMLNRAVMAYFRNHPGVTFDVSMNSIRHRKYQVYGSNLIGYTHGDGAKEKDLPNIMQYECREWWGKTMRGYWITKHTHHKSRKSVGLQPAELEKDHIGVTILRHDDSALDRNVSVEVVRSPSGTDGWHDRNGYVGALKAVEAFLFHRKRGNVARFTYPFYG